MSYTPTTWTTGDTITASALNKIENGIANAGGGGCVVATLWQIDSSTIGVDGDFSAALAKVSQGIPIAACWYGIYTASSGGFSTTKYPVLCGVSYDSSSPDEIKLWYSSSDYVTWTENGAT